MTTIAKVFYRPSENHVGAIYRWGRFKRYAEPDRWTILLPWIERVMKEVRMDMRTAHILLENVLSRDRVPFDLELKIFFFVDLREAAPERRMQTLRFPNESAWEEIVKTGITDIVRNVIIVARSFDELTTQNGRGSLKQDLSSTLAERIRGFGILINPQFGVNIMNMQPNKIFQYAMQEESAAATYGVAAVDRLSPLLENFMGQNPERALTALLMQMSAAIARNGEVPDIVFPGVGDFPAGAAGNRRRPPNQPNLRWPSANPSSD